MKLMLRLPAVRGQLQLLTARDRDLLNLCGAFEEASSTLDSLRKHPTDDTLPRIAEYEALCDEIEDDILSICYEHSPPQKS